MLRVSERSVSLGRTLSAIAATSDGFEEMPDLFPETKELLVALPVRTSVGLAPELQADPKTLLNGAAALCAGISTTLNIGSTIRQAGTIIWAGLRCRYSM